MADVESFRREVLAFLERELPEKLGEMPPADGLAPAQSTLLGHVDQGYATLARVLDEATVALCGEMLGGMSAAFEATCGYLRERRHFGVPIGSFQALKHRAARLHVELELTRTAVMAAARALDAESPEAPSRLSSY